MNTLRPDNLLEAIDLIPQGNGYRYDIPVSPLNFRDSSGLALTGSGNQKVIVTSGRPAVVLTASAAGAAMIALPLPGCFDRSAVRTAGMERPLDGDLFDLRLLISCSTAGPRNLTASLRNSRVSANPSFTNPSDVVKAINSTSVLEYVFSFTGSGFYPRDVAAVTLTAENAAGDISIWGGQLTIKNNLAMYERTDR